jgi:hypothetical protein
LLKKHVTTDPSLQNSERVAHATKLIDANHPECRLCVGVDQG